MQFLEKLRLKLVDFDSAKLQKKFSEFNQLLEQGDNLGAFSLLSGFEAELNQKTSELESINDNLENALLRAEQDAIIAVANAKKLLDSSSNTELKKAFDLAQKELSKKNFFKAIVLARGITDSFSANNNLPAAGFAGFSLQKIPLAVYPLAAVIAVVIVFRLQKNNSAQQKQRLQKLLRNH
jgi:hypothetical protein